MSTPASSSSPVSSWNLPNVLTGIRILLVPVFIVLLAADGGAHGVLRWLAAALFVVAIYTDKLDGDIARARGLVTNFGKIADPIADKLLTGSALVMLSLLGELWWWVTIVILVREWGITALRFWVIRYGVMAASAGGKLKTVLQAAAIILLLMPLGTVLGSWALWLGWLVMAAALVVTVVTGVAYVRDALRLRREGSRA
ncbi:CDP-diacylglycerol--glycerol-3-phosphate 3-phosphatidyltransferase [Tersicoccus solisilvae]|uniref:CDP-diacylglycerol--glycerol-3-phosphate 3-phosphatidyltransferase n=1 Tax=Tersicoccus solisilvae TaxID=1882339 RepID=A0ABQ1PQ21_9MICC|nr:CDP-diacylglycerol--glycerol-3-phosphate 3-phosphatidyltransferase [Tersicoccus solisilvae]GGD00975.1 CDP-diacylglycerol--glycerol-3-phosphate 3-phosphatidyltransferase [Tersicoccus solisilvae]